MNSIERINKIAKYTAEKEHVYTDDQYSKDLDTIKLRAVKQGYALRESMREDLVSEADKFGLSLDWNYYKLNYEQKKKAILHLLKLSKKEESSRLSVRACRFDLDEIHAKDYLFEFDLKEKKITVKAYNLGAIKGYAECGFDGKIRDYSNLKSLTIKNFIKEDCIEAEEKIKVLFELFSEAYPELISKEEKEENGKK